MKSRSKKILSLDGGGVRGSFAIAVLEEIERYLRKRTDGRNSIATYFDLIGGTSTGAIIAGGLAAAGMSATQLRDFYFKNADTIFRQSGVPFILPLFEGKSFRRLLDDIFGDTNFASNSINPILAITCKRVDVPSSWLIHSHSMGLEIYSSGPTATRRARLEQSELLVSRIVQASAAAPYFFSPVTIKYSKNRKGKFIDGALTGHNNPSLKLLTFILEETNWIDTSRQMSYHESYSAESSALDFTSIGTGSLNRPIFVSPRTSILGRLLQKSSGAQALNALKSMITSTEDLVDEAMRAFASRQTVMMHPDVHRTQPSQPITSTDNSVRSNLIDFEEKAVSQTRNIDLRYTRFNVRLSRDWISRNVGLNLTEAQIETLRKMEKADAVSIAYDIGKAYAERHISDTMFVS